MSQSADDATKLSGTVFSRVVRAGALAVVREQESLNRINVFPVRDADTGANLAATLRAAASRLGARLPTPSATPPEPLPTAPSTAPAATPGRSSRSSCTASPRRWNGSVRPTAPSSRPPP